MANYLTTRTGDNGTTQIAGVRVQKSSDLIIGMAFLNICESYIADIPEIDDHVSIFCEDVINHMYHIKALYHKHAGEIPDEKMSAFIEYLDDFLENTHVPKVNFFIRPIKKNVGCFKANGYVRMTECFIRKLEGSEALGKYLNRLSSCLHALALYMLTENEVEKSNVNYVDQFVKETNKSNINVICGLLVLFYLMILIWFA